MQSLAWLWQYKTKNADIVDVTWAFSMVVCSIFYYSSLFPSKNAGFLMLIFPGLWYLRLSWHLVSRYNQNHEDNRYKYLRKHWHTKTQLKFLAFFLIQAFLAWLFVLPAYWLLDVQFAIKANIVLAFIIGSISLIGVTISDRQLLVFKRNKDNKNKVCDQGLWKYSRHPNYFFEWLHWFVYPILLLDSQYFYWALVYPFLMLYFLLKLTGIPFAEQQSLINRGDVYRDYQNKTNKFFLWKPKSD